MAEDRTGVVARLDALEAAHKAATKGPWQYDPETPGEVWDSDERYPHVLGGCEESADAAAIVAEHNAFPELLAAVRGVLDLADEMAASADMPDTHGEFDRGVAAHQRDAADRLRATVAAALGEA